MYAGAISYLAVLLWAATASVCLFAAMVLGPGAGSLFPFLWRAGLLSAWLCADDLMEIHERVLPYIGVPEVVTYAAYGAATLAYLFVSRGVVVTTQWWLLAVAAASFGISVLVDVVLVFPPETSPWLLVEEAFKVIGLVAWLIYYVDAAAAGFTRMRASRP